jgi:adenine-specific DNA methylase
LARLSTAGAGIEKRFDTAFVAELALREKQIQQNYRPVIAVHKWFARRPGTLFRALLLAEFASEELRQSYFTPQSLAGVRVADPFMGGGTPLLEANRLGCDVLGFDINPMAYWVVRQEIEQLDLEAYQRAAARVDETLAREVGRLYQTRCVICGRLDASAKYFLWVKTRPCEQCGVAIDLFPGYVVAKKGRHTAHVLVARRAGP